VPIYEYACGSCGHLVEVMQRISDPAPASCPACGKPELSRQISRTTFQLKGGGWYADLYGSSKKTEASAVPAKPPSTESAKPAPAPAPAPASAKKTEGG
jgi:putative FmdB family regulatory protein